MNEDDRIDRVTFTSTTMLASGCKEVVTVTSETSNLFETICMFERFLRAAGFIFDGNIKLVEDVEVRPIINPPTQPLSNP